MDEARARLLADQERPFKEDGAIHDYSTGELPKEGTQTWDTEGLQRDFEVLGFAAPFVSVMRREDGAVGTLQFNHMPRMYWGFQVD